MFEYLIIAVLVGWSAIVVFKKVFPQTANAMFMSLSNVCQHFGWQRLALRLKPKMVVGCGGGLVVQAMKRTIKKLKRFKP